MKIRNRINVKSNFRGEKVEQKKAYICSMIELQIAPLINWVDKLLTIILCTVISTFYIVIPTSSDHRKNPTVDGIIMFIPLLNKWDQHFQGMEACWKDRNQSPNLVFKSNRTLSCQQPGSEMDDPADREVPCISSESAQALQRRCSRNYDTLGKFSVFNGPQPHTSTSSVTCQSNPTLCPKSLVSLRICKLQRTDLQLWCVIRSISWKCMSARFFFFLIFLR